MQSLYDLYVSLIGKSNGYSIYQSVSMLVYMCSLLILFGNFYSKDRLRETLYIRAKLVKIQKAE